MGTEMLRSDFHSHCLPQLDDGARDVETAHAMLQMLSEQGIEPYGKEGFSNADWVLLDYSDVVVHIFTPDSREFFNIEKLWADAKRIDTQDFLTIKQD